MGCDAVLQAFTAEAWCCAAFAGKLRRQVRRTVTRPCRGPVWLAALLVPRRSGAGRTSIYSTCTIWLNSLPAEVASSVDFLLPGISPEGLPLHEPGELAPATLRFRRLLVAWNVCSAEDALSYTSHSCKTTLLSFAKQLDLNKSWSASQGHHRQPVAQGTAVPLYSRDDVIDALRLQCQIVCHLGRGWRPCMVQRRGAQPPLAEPFPFSVAGCLPSDISALETIVLNPALPASVLFPALGLCDSSDAHEGRKGRKRKEMDPSAAELNHNDEAHSEKDRLRSLKFSAFLERKSRSRARS